MRNIHRLVQYLLQGNAANIHFADKSSLLSEPDIEDEHWMKGTGCFSIIIIYN